MGVTRRCWKRTTRPRATFKRGLDPLSKAKEMPASAGVNTPVMRPTQFVKNVGDQKRLEAIYSPQEVAEINAAVNAARRMGDSTGYNFSGTAPAQNIGADEPGHHGRAERNQRSRKHGARLEEAGAPDERQQRQGRVAGAFQIAHAITTGA